MKFVPIACPCIWGVVLEGQCNNYIYCGYIRARVYHKGTCPFLFYFLNIEL